MTQNDPLQNETQNIQPTPFCKHNIPINRGCCMCGAEGEASAELAATKKAKAENDERFMLERDEARAELTQAVARVESLSVEGVRLVEEMTSTRQSLSALRDTLAALDSAALKRMKPERGMNFGEAAMELPGMLEKVEAERDAGLAAVRALSPMPQSVLDVAERRISLLRNALEQITSTAKEVKTVNTQDFMEHLRHRAGEAEVAWNEDIQQPHLSSLAKSSPASAPSDPQTHPTAIDYTNWKGERATREIIPHSIFFGATPWHPHRQWLLDAFDCGKHEHRFFALTGIHAWGVAPSAPPSSSGDASKTNPVLTDAKLTSAGGDAERRVVEGADPIRFPYVHKLDDGGWEFSSAGERSTIPTSEVAGTKCPYGIPGDRLWVRETWARRSDVDPASQREKCLHYLKYRADADDLENEWHHYGRWRPSIHMPRWASRITLEVTAVRVERLQEISEVDAFAEGVESRFCARCDESGVEDGGPCPDCAGDGRFRCCSVFRELWESINGKGSWALSPWVWVVEFKRVDADAEGGK